MIYLLHEAFLCALHQRRKAVLVSCVDVYWVPKTKHCFRKDVSCEAYQF